MEKHISTQDSEIKDLKEKVASLMGKICAHKIQTLFFDQYHYPWNFFPSISLTVQANSILKILLQSM